MNATLAILLCSVIPFPICLARQATLDNGHFHSDLYGYHLDLPNDWVEIPKDVLQNTLGAGQKPDAPVKLAYDSGFQPDSGDHWFAYPYVLVQPLSYASFGLHRQVNEDQFPEIIRSMTGLDADKVADKHFTSDVRERLKNVAVDRPQLDPARRRYLWTVNMDIKGIGPVRGLMVGYFGRDSLVSVLFYSRASDWDRDEDVCCAIVDSFRFDSHKAYSATLAANNPTPSRSVWDGVLPKALGGGIVALIFSAIIGIMNKKRTTADHAMQQDAP